ncbi:MAG TPA: Rrf2 family transcriptional regulator [Candidatus Acidoferrales bacterium]|nr:Rrf2 family transcriptional regulator [Candidatus Acidoferrales bacterium]
MQLTRAADYAVRVMIHLAGLPPDARVSRSELSAAAECPEQFLSKVLQNLTRAGLIVSRRGNTGGFELDARHRDASLLEVVEAIEGPIRLNLCLNSDHSCSRQGWCPAHLVWAKAQKAMVEVLGATTIGELARSADDTRQKGPVTIEELPWN